MSVFVLKIIAMTAMVLDHLAFALRGSGIISGGLYVVMRSVGRISFPIFCFLIANGYVHSRDKLKYLTRLILFALISQIPYTLVFSARNYHSSGIPGMSFTPPSAIYILLCLAAAILWYLYIRRDASALLPFAALFSGLSSWRINGLDLLLPDMNVFFTLALALAAMCLLDKLLSQKYSFKELVPQMLALAVAFAAVGTRADYGIDGIVLLLALWLFRENRGQQLVMILLWSGLHYLPGGLNLPYLLCSAAAAIPVWLYNGRLGRALKTAFYLVYPVHLLLAALIVLT